MKVLAAITTHRKVLYVFEVLLHVGVDGVVKVQGNMKAIENNINV